MRTRSTITNRALAWTSLALFFICVEPLLGQRELTKIPDSDPEVERRSFQMADGFEVNLFAADPLLAKPIQMNFDSTGRLWVACSEVYPQIRPGQKANDKIIVLEDRDGRGRADKTTVFAAGLLIPTGVEPGDGGAYVASGTDLLHLADTDGDGRADRSRLLLSGFGTEDTHHILHTLRWGPDGMLYFNQSIYIHSHIETPHGVRRLGGGGVWQFRPETMGLEVFVRGFVNPWGHHFDRWGQSFATDGAYGDGINYLLPGATYILAPGASRVLPGLNPGSPKHCGLEVLSGRHLPPEWQGNILTNDFRGHRVCRFVISDDGAGYASQEKTELIKTNHAAFRPVDIKMGPDGAIYIADWYNPIIQHGEVDFRDPRRDHVHGRIWRVTAKGRPVVPRPQLKEAATEALLNSLKLPEEWTRRQAKRVLKERGSKVLPALADWVHHVQAEDPEREHHLLEALWTYQSLDVVEPALLQTLLRAHDGRVRAAATRVASYWLPRLTKPLELLADRVNDEHPRVRLEAVRALANLATREAASLAMKAVDHPVDGFLDYALWLTARDLESVWMPLVLQNQKVFGENARHLIFALKAVDTTAVVGPLVELLRGGKVPVDQQESVLLVIAKHGGPRELGMILDSIFAARGRDLEHHHNLLIAIEKVSRQRHLVPAGDLNRIAPLLGGGNESIRAVLLRLAGLWKLEGLRAQMSGYAADAKSSDVIRQAAIDSLASLGGPASRQALEGLCAPDKSPAVRKMAVVALAGLDLKLAATSAVAVLAGNPIEEDTTAVFQAFFQRKKGAESLTAALAGKSLPPDVTKIGARLVRASGKDNPSLIQALNHAGGLTAGPRPLSPDEMRRMVMDVAQKGDAARGEINYRRRDLGCTKCHAIGGAGGQVGPDLTSIGASAPVDYLIESVLLPNKAVKENYHALIVATKEGRLFTGIKARETNAELVLRDGEDHEISVPLNSIEERTMGGSLMPDGLADALTRHELVDLVRFLSELGKVGPYAVSKKQVARRWQILDATTLASRHVQYFGLASILKEDPTFNWVPGYSKVSGALPLTDLPILAAGLGTGNLTYAFVRCHIECSTPGKTELALPSAAGLNLWLDGRVLESKPRLVLDLTTGLHTLTLAIDLAQRREDIRCELEEVSGSPARVRFLGGK